MRLLLALIANLILVLKLALGLPFRLLRARRRPEFIRHLLRNDPPYRAAGRRRWRWFDRRDPCEVRSLEELRRQLQTIARDSRVRGAVFVLEQLEIPPAKIQTIASLWAELKQSGKQVIGYAVQPGNSEYQLLCAADQIVISPAGRLQLTGFAAEATALGAGLRRFGVAAHFVRRGEYKTAPELFTETTVSEIHRRTIEQFLDERYQALIEQIAAGRRLSLADAKRLVDEGPYSARRALGLKLCDALCSEAELPDLLQVRAGGDRSEGVAGFAAFQSSQPWPAVLWRRLRRKPRLALVPLTGIIGEGQGGKVPIGPEFAGSDSVASALKAAARDPASAAILLYVSSPGGSSVASEIMLEEVKRAAKKKPVVAYFDRVAASGGYMAALGAKEIWAGPQAIAGSIGVFGGKFDFSDLFERLGIHRTLITRGENSGLFSLSRPFTEHERRSLEAEVEDTYQSFLERVAEARGQSKEEVQSRAEGRVYSGHAALKAGLIDAVGSFDDACRRALKLANAPGELYEVALYRTAPRRVPLLRLARLASETRLFALWFPWIEIRGLGGAEDFG
ncbi:MAG TPA: signal peptide peptidase SppA [Myxococcaceae bacterium]|nr:signal peptide peptidase SppA [Myxococcaceae bacterium]